MSFGENPLPQTFPRIKACCPAFPELTKLSPFLAPEGERNAGAVLLALKFGEPCRKKSDGGLRRDTMVMRYIRCQHRMRQIPEKGPKRIPCPHVTPGSIDRWSPLKAMQDWWYSTIAKLVFSIQKAWV